jgi:hypothetical protein
MVSILVAIALLDTSSAHANSLRLPERMTPPPVRPEVASIFQTKEAPVQAERRPISRSTIGITPQPIPPSRQAVRVVGPKFLPDQSDAIELVGEAAARARRSEN